MPRKPRFYLPGIPAHIVQRGNCRQATFFSDDDYTAYLRWLHEGAEQHECAIHAYVLMTNHVHLLVTPTQTESISRLIQYVGRHYVTYVNHTYGKSGTLWEGRHKGCLISSDEYLLACMRYIELNPVRAGMVAAPGDYRWSSYRINAEGSGQGLLTPHPLYLVLGWNQSERAYAYRELFRSALEPDQVHNIRATVQTGTPLATIVSRSRLSRLCSARSGNRVVDDRRRNYEKGTDPFNSLLFYSALTADLGSYFIYNDNAAAASLMIGTSAEINAAGFGLSHGAASRVGSGASLIFNYLNSAKSP